MRGLEHSPEPPMLDLVSWQEKIKELPDRGIRAYQRLSRRSKVRGGMLQVSGKADSLQNILW